MKVLVHPSPPLHPVLRHLWCVYHLWIVQANMMTVAQHQSPVTVYLNESKRTASIALSVNGKDVGVDWIIVCFVWNSQSVCAASSARPEKGSGFVKDCWLAGISFICFTCHKSFSVTRETSIQAVLCTLFVRLKSTKMKMKMKSINRQRRPFGCSGGSVGFLLPWGGFPTVV